MRIQNLFMALLFTASALVAHAKGDKRPVYGPDQVTEAVISIFSTTRGPVTPASCVARHMLGEREDVAVTIVRRINTALPCAQIMSYGLRYIYEQLGNVDAQRENNKVCFFTVRELIVEANAGCQRYLRRKGQK